MLILRRLFPRKRYPPAGYYLIALMGTISIIWAIAAVMIVMALLYGAGLRVSRARAII